MLVNNLFFKIFSPVPMQSIPRIDNKVGKDLLYLGLVRINRRNLLFKNGFYTDILPDQAAKYFIHGWDCLINI